MVTQPSQPLLSLHFDGPAIQDTAILWEDLAQFVTNLDSAIQRIINVLETGTSIHIGRPTRAFQALTALEISGITPGSFAVGLNLRRTQDLLPGFDLGVQAVRHLMEGLAAVERQSELPKEFDRGVLMALREAGRILDRGVDQVQIIPRQTLQQPRAVYARVTRETIISRIRVLEQEWTEAEGRLLMADVREGSLRCRLHPSTGSPLICTYSEDLATEVMKNLRRFVRIRGIATIDPAAAAIRSFEIRDLEPIEELTHPPIPVVPPSMFWEPRSFEELAAEQGIYPLEDWTAITTGWPDDADFDSFLAAVRSVRDE